MRGVRSRHVGRSRCSGAHRSRSRRPPSGRPPVAILVLALAAAAGLARPAAAQAPQDETDVLITAARKAYDACAAKGYATTVSLVNTAGQALVVIHSEKASIFTIEGSFAKAYTIMALGPGKHVEANSALAEVLKIQSPVTYKVHETPQQHISLTPGSVLVRRQGRLIGGLGVSGSPTGELDEACAKEAVGDIH